MSNEYIEVKTSHNDIGKIAMSLNAIEGIVVNSLEEIKNIEVAQSTTFTKPIDCKVVNGELHLQVNIKVKKNCNVYDLSSIIQNKINISLTQMANISCHTINIKIVEFLF